MGLIIANLVKDKAPGAAATVVSDIEIKKSFTVQALNFQAPSRAADTNNATLAVLVGLMASQLRINTVLGQPQSTIDGVDLYDFNVLGLRESPLVNRSATDNDPLYVGMTYPFSPFPYDFDRNYGLPPNLGTNIELDWLVDPATVDGRTLTITAVGNPDAKSPLGWLSFTRDARTAAAVGEELKTKIQGAKRLLGVHVFGTTNYADIAAAGAFDVTTFRSHSLLESGDVKLGPIQDHYLRSYGNYENGSIIDEGSELWDLGLQVTGDPVGIDVSAGEWEYSSIRGVADAGRQYPVLLR